MRPQKNIELMEKLVKFGARPCGSSYVLSAEPNLIEKSDSDFYILESQLQEFRAMFPGFAEVLFLKYRDDFTTGLFVYRHVEPVDWKTIKGSSSSTQFLDFVDLDDNHSTIEVTVKRDGFAIGIANMWKILCADPELFKTKFWKKGGTGRDVIRARIKNLILALN
jgi:hypothetical protein